MFSMKMEASEVLHIHLLHLDLVGSQLLMHPWNLMTLWLYAQ